MPVEKIIVYREDIPCTSPIQIIKKIRDYQKNLLSLLALEDCYYNDRPRLNDLITVSLKGIKDYVDRYKDRFATCAILSRDINGYRVLYDILWEGEPGLINPQPDHPNSNKNDQNFLCRNDS